MNDDLSPEAKALLEKLLAGSVAPVNPYAERLKNFAVRRKWLATAWLMGASYGQLALREDVNRATIAQAVYKELPSDTRASLRLAQSLKDTELDWYAGQFRTHPQLYTLAPTAIAAWLLSYATFPGD